MSINSFNLLWTSSKYPYSPHIRDWNFLGGGGFCKTQRFKEMCKALLESEGWEVLEKILSLGEVWIVFGTTHCQYNLRRLFAPGKCGQTQTVHKSVVYLYIHRPHVLILAWIHSLPLPWSYLEINESCSIFKPLLYSATLSQWLQIIALNVNLQIIS